MTTSGSPKHPRFADLLGGWGAHRLSQFESSRIRFLTVQCDRMQSRISKGARHTGTWREDRGKPGRASRFFSQRTRTDAARFESASEMLSPRKIHDRPGSPGSRGGQVTWAASGWRVPASRLPEAGRHSARAVPCTPAVWNSGPLSSVRAVGNPRNPSSPMLAKGQPVKLSPQTWQSGLSVTSFRIIPKRTVLALAGQREYAKTR